MSHCLTQVRQLLLEQLSLLLPSRPWINNKEWTAWRIKGQWSLIDSFTSNPALDVPLFRYFDHSAKAAWAVFGLDVTSDPAKENGSSELDPRRGTMATRLELITGNTVEALGEITSACSHTQSLQNVGLVHQLLQDLSVPSRWAAPHHTHLFTCSVHIQMTSRQNTVHETPFPLVPLQNCKHVVSFLQLLSNSYITTFFQLFSLHERTKYCVQWSCCRISFLTQPTYLCPFCVLRLQG